MVGAVVVRDGRVVGRGYHARAGAPHAEVMALRQAGRRARGARLYLNLEPCCHVGRTPPCTDAILASGVSEVIACMRDPDPRVSGRGFRALRRAGVKVSVGGLEEEARRLNESFLRFQRTGLPFVTLKAGMSLDGRIATRDGESRWITARGARRAARRLRSGHDAVLVGVGTVLADDPELLADGGGRPIRVVLDGHLRTPERARLFRSGGPVLIMTRRGAPAGRRRRLEQRGALVVEVASRGGRVDLQAALADLGRRGIATVLIEGGGDVLGSALDAGVGDRLALFVAPRLIGGLSARPAFAGRGARRLRHAAEVKDARIRSVGEDWLIEGTIRHARTIS
jgi:diaminohydroxyphosphoribosylaminopyrimidine deaminase/5-amino-6-(5-phosphoribosylamino)uracil reductase